MSWDGAIFTWYHTISKHNTAKDDTGIIKAYKVNKLTTILPYLYLYCDISNVYKAFRDICQQYKSLRYMRRLYMRRIYM